MMPKIASVKSSSGRQVAMVPYSALSVGSLTFFDRTYKFKDIGDYSADCLFMKISNNDKNTAASKTQYTISLSERSVIYLDFWGGEQHAKKGFSTWSSGWKLSSKPSTSFDSWGPGVVYEKVFAAGDVTLKGNDGNNHGSYYAFICPASAEAAEEKEEAQAEPEWVKGFCTLNGHDQNSGVIKVNSVDGNTEDAQDVCMEACLAHVG